MTKTIAQLWNGNVDPIQYFGRDNEEIKQLETLLQRNLEKLDAALNETQKILFEKYYACTNEYLLITSEQAFCDGFCLGEKMTAEAFLHTEKIIAR